MFEAVDTGIAPPRGPISGTVRRGSLLLTAQVPKDPVSGAIVQGDIETQTRRALGNLRMALEAAGGSLADVMMVQVFLIDAADAAGMNRVWAETFRPPYPCRATVVVKELLAPGMRIELTATAQLGAAGEPAMAGNVIVVGAGVAGLSTALYLQRGGFRVLVLDPLGAAGGASFGNAGLLSSETVVPIALPGMLRKLPRWLVDRRGPLSLRPSYLPRAAPWLARWVAAGRMERVLAISDAMRALHAPAFDCWRELLGEVAYADLIRRTGQVQVWEGTQESPTAAVERLLRERHGIAAEPLGPDELRQLFPGLARHITRGLLVPDNGHTVSPAAAVRMLSELLQVEGGALLPERVLKLIPREGGGWMAMTNLGNHEADSVVVAGGAWSRALLEPLGVRIPLETERGYHATIPAPNLVPGLPILHKSRGFGMTAMQEGLRIAGTVEIAGLDAAPDERRAKVLVQHAKTLFPGLEGWTPRLWMGFRPSTPDSLPVLGPVPRRPGLFLCLGHGHFGMTGGPPSGRLVASLVAGLPPPVDPAPYSIRRFGLLAGFSLGGLARRLRRKAPPPPPGAPPPAALPPPEEPPPAAAA